MSTGVVVRGVVLEGTGGMWRVHTVDGEVHEASMRGRLKQEAAVGAAPVLKLAVGDDVDLERDARDGVWAIVRILPRRSTLARRNPGGRWGERVIAANVDQVVVVFAAAQPDPHPRMLDRFLVIAEGNELAARIVVNKAELVGGRAVVEARFALYVAAGYPLHAISVNERDGLDAVREAFAGRNSVVTGPSGVGKSSLLNALYPGLALRVGEVSEAVQKGRHTTVGALLHPIAGGGSIIDTPGLREVGLWGFVPEEIATCFPEFRPFLGTCRFGDCTHTVEPGCAVRAAIGGAIAPGRYDSFTSLRDEALAGD